MTIVSRPDHRHQNASKVVTFGVAGFLLTILLLISIAIEGSPSPAKSATNVETKTIKIKLEQGEVNGISYYHCSGSEATTKNKRDSQEQLQSQQHLVLLHGARFTKVDWRASGLLSKLCDVPNLSVSAMDLPVSSGSKELKAMLDGMKEKNLISFPVTLVTPSASGKTMTDWIKSGDISDMPTYLNRWIPVAAGSVSSVQEDLLESLQQIQSPKVSIFAIYGKLDSMGKKTSERLQEYAGAKVLEINGGHPCYLDSPEEFFDALKEDMSF